MSDEYISLQDARFYVAVIINELNDLVEHGCMDIADLDWRVLMEKILRINDLPTADVTPVVRCRDCKHYKDGWCYNPNTYDDEKTRGNTSPEWYCADGERRA